MKRRIALLGCSGLALAASACAGDDAWLRDGRRALATAEQLAPQSLRSQRARNVVILLGDGMGITTITAARILEGQQRGEPGEENELAFEQLPYVSLAKVYETNQQTPDSAGTMTAIVTGAKTRAGLLSVDETVSRGDAAGVEGHRLTTLFEEAEQRGLSTGVVTTTTVTHATPAACYAHSPERGWEDDTRLSAEAHQHDFPDIARQLLEFPHGDGLEVALGGGRIHFLPRSDADPVSGGTRGDGRDLTAEWTRRSGRSRYVSDRAQLDAVLASETDHLLGLFTPSHMSFEVDRDDGPAGEPSLSEMTAKALEILSRNPRGFLLMVEGGRIDHGHHIGNAYRALTETIEFSNAVRTVLEHTNPLETLVVVTADHGHVFTIGGYATRGNDILGKAVANDLRGEPEQQPALDALGLPYTVVGYMNGPGYSGANTQQPEGPKRLTPITSGFQGIAQGRPDLSAVDTADPDYLQEATVPMHRDTHSAEDVPVYAGGPGAQRFHGVQEQSYLYHAMVEALGWRRESAPDR